MERLRALDFDPTVKSAFPEFVKESIRKKQRGICASCGEKPKKLQVHHKQPLSMGGSDLEENGVGLCEPDHKIADYLAIKHGIPYEIVKIFIQTAPANLLYERPKK